MSISSEVNHITIYVRCQDEPLMVRGIFILKWWNHFPSFQNRVTLQKQTKGCNISVKILGHYCRGCMLYFWMKPLQTTLFIQFTCCIFRVNSCMNLLAQLRSTNSNRDECLVHVILNGKMCFNLVSELTHFPPFLLLCNHTRKHFLVFFPPTYFHCTYYLCF